MTAPRIPIPKLFDEAWDSVLIVTYSADLVFFERILLRQLGETRNRVILADERQVTRYLSDADNRAQLQQVNRTYVMAPIRVLGAAHAKLIMLLSEDKGRLVVGSGNLGLNGYASQGECFTSYRWSEEVQTQQKEFLAARSFIDQILERRLVDMAVRERVEKAWNDAPWLYRSAPPGQSRVRHNLDRPLLGQFIQAIDGRPVEELTVHAPFYDSECRALAELVNEASPATLQVLLQAHQTSVNPDKLREVLASVVGRVDVRSIEAAKCGTPLHAKFLIARCEESAICLQGSPNLSTPALLRTHPGGNIELANVLIGNREAFDHLVSDLSVSSEQVDVLTLGLSLAADRDAEDDTPPARMVPELCWDAPELTGVFDREVEKPPQVLIDGVPIAEVEWELLRPSNGTTKFVARLNAEDLPALDHVAAVSFIFDTGEESSPTFPFHLDTLRNLSANHGRTDLLARAGDFDIEDEQLEQLLVQLEAALIVDGRSIWRILRRTIPDTGSDEDPVAMKYEELDWNIIRSHSSVAQYQRLGNTTTASDTPLSILLASIAAQFATVQTRPPGGEHIDTTLDALEELGQEMEPEDEDATEANEIEKERRRLKARERARRHFHRFVRRFVDGLTDTEFVRRVGPSVIVPSYVIFNHLCWKLIHIELADPLRVIDAQTALWRFFWGDGHESGYFARMSVDEQEAALEILDHHNSEAVLICSLYQADSYARTLDDESVRLSVRNAFRTILLHPMWQPTKTAALKSAEILQHSCKSLEGLIQRLEELASYVSHGEPFAAIAHVLKSQPEQVTLGRGKVEREPLGSQVVDIYTVDDLDEPLTPELASRAFSTLKALRPEDDYLRLVDRAHRVVTFVDYRLNRFVHARLLEDEDEELDLPTVQLPPWCTPLRALREMAAS
ncbi:MAG: hypothetical protein OXI33_02280 [Chloroflexota bacterium]|nr:hypothetical protein [Chloroflexota bacterium]